MENIYNKFTTHFKKSILGAYGLSLAAKKKEIGVAELFWALLSEKGSLGQETLLKAGVKQQTRSNNTMDDSGVKLSEIIEAKQAIPLAEKVKHIIIESANLAASYEHAYIGTEHLLYSLVEARSEEIKKILKEYNVRDRDLLKNLEAVLGSTSKFSDMTGAMSSLKYKIKQGEKKKKRRDDSLLEFFGRELTEEEVQKNINPVIGREAEISRVIQILSRRDKNNPILLGEPGVGKTAIVEGLAKKILKGEVPDFLADKKIYSLDMPLLVAGTSYRGEFEARIKQIVEEVKEDESIILFIDEIHNIMGAGAASGTMDAANILKPALARGEIRCIGATTYSDYKKFIEVDQALARRMQRVVVNEPGATEAVQILKGIKESYEKHHLLQISDEAIEEAVSLSERYITDQFLPDKAIDLIDEAASKKRISQPRSARVQKISALKKELRRTAEEKNLLVAEGKYEEALKLKPKEIELASEIFRLEELEIKEKMSAGQDEAQANMIGAEEIRELVRESTKINILDHHKSSGLVKNLEESLNKKVVGQEKAIQELVNTLKRSTAGLAGEKRPLGSFIFAGPSGVGKTYTAKILSENISAGREGLVKLDMSEFGEKFNASKLIGAPAGYVGYEEGGQLTEKIKRNPYAVILLDEIEKAHPDIFNLFLQIFEDGYLTDSKGRRVNFRNTIIIMTTNAGLKRGTQGATVGFERDSSSAGSDVKESLADFLRPELLNRIDQIVVFNALSKQDLSKIIRLELEHLKENLARREIKLKYERKVIGNLLKDGLQENQGARMIREVIREKIENPLAERILEGRDKKTINLEVRHDTIVFE